MDFSGSAGNSGDAAVYRHRRRSSAATVELAAAAALRLAPDYFLASGWNSGAVPDPLRGIGTPRFRPLEIPPSHVRALGAHDPRGAGTIPARHARTLRLRPIHQREPGAMKPCRKRCAVRWATFSTAQRSIAAGANAATPDRAIHYR